MVFWMKRQAASTAYLKTNSRGMTTRRAIFALVQRGEARVVPAIQIFIVLPAIQKKVVRIVRAVRFIPVVVRPQNVKIMRDIIPPRKMA
jgi:hypothetical protein